MKNYIKENECIIWNILLMELYMGKQKCEAKVSIQKQLCRPDGRISVDKLPQTFRGQVLMSVWRPFCSMIEQAWFLIEMMIYHLQAIKPLQIVTKRRLRFLEFTTLIIATQLDRFVCRVAWK